MAGKPAEQWYTGDWFRSVDIRKCTWATRGIWREMLDVMVNEQEAGKISGTKEEVCRVIGCCNAEFDTFLAENERHKFADVTHENGTVTIINRRMYRAFLERKATKHRVAKHRKRNCNANVTPPSSSSSSSSSSLKETTTTTPRTREEREPSSFESVAEGVKAGCGKVIKLWNTFAKQPVRSAVEEMTVERSYSGLVNGIPPNRLSPDEITGAVENYRLACGLEASQAPKLALGRFLAWEIVTKYLPGNFTLESYDRRTFAARDGPNQPFDAKATEERLRAKGVI